VVRADKYFWAATAYTLQRSASSDTFELGMSLSSCVMELVPGQLSYLREGGHLVVGEGEGAEGEVLLNERGRRPWGGGDRDALLVNPSTAANAAQRQPAICELMQQPHIHSSREQQQGAAAGNSSREQQQGSHAAHGEHGTAAAST
jgi:hypothetical protein